MQIYHVAQKKSLEGHQNQNSAYLEIPTMHVALLVTCAITSCKCRHKHLPTVLQLNLAPLAEVLGGVVGDNIEGIVEAEGCLGANCLCLRRNMGERV